MIFAAATGAACFCAFALMHLMVPRIAFDTGRASLAIRLAPMFAIAIAAAVLAAWLGSGLVPRGPAGFLVSLLWGELAFFGLFVLYMPVLYTFTHSISVATLCLLVRSRGTRLEESELAGIFTSEEFIEARLAAMARSGYLDDTAPPYRLRARGRAVARFFSWLQDLWCLGPGG